MLKYTKMVQNPTGIDMGNEVQNPSKTIDNVFLISIFQDAFFQNMRETANIDPGGSIANCKPTKTNKRRYGEKRNINNNKNTT